MSSGKEIREDDLKQEVHRDVLLKVYDAALEECRFNVNLSWERTKFFLVLNSGLIAAGLGLFKFAEGDASQQIFLILYFLLCAAICVFGLESSKVGKRYYREAVFVKTVVEKELGLLDPLPNFKEANLSIAVTPGQRDYQAILARNIDPNTPIAFNTNIGYLRGLFWTMVGINALAALMCAVNVGRLLANNLGK